MSFEELLKQKCTIEKKGAETRDSLGQPTYSYTKVDNVKSRFAPVRQPNIVIGSYKVTLEDFLFYFMPDLDINEGDRIITDENTFEVAYVSKDSEGHHLQVYARAVERR